MPSRAAGLVLSADTDPKSPNAQKIPDAPVRPESPAAEPGYIWDLAATDVFPAADGSGPQAAAPGAVREDGDPGAS